MKTTDRPRTAFRPGINLVRGGLLLPALAGLYLLTGWTWAAWLLIPLSGLGTWAAVQEGRLLRRQLDALSVKRLLPAVGGRGLPFDVAWEVSFDGHLPEGGSLRDVLPAACTPRFFEVPLFRNMNPLRIEAKFVIPQRGRHVFGPIWIRLLGSLRLVEAQRAFDLPGAIKILPERFVSRDELLKDQGATQILLDKTTKARHHGTGSEFESLSEYREGDDPLRIDWRATARLRRPIVRRFQIERHRDVMILIDCGRLMGARAGDGTKLDCAIDAALILAHTALSGGDRCGIGLYDSVLRGYLTPQAGAPALKAIVDAVYAAQSEFRESDFSPMFATLQSRQAKRSLIVVLSDVIDVETSESFRASLARLGRQHVVLLAALRTPDLERVLAEPLDDLLDASRKVVAFRLQRERRQAINTLSHGGVFVLDVEPSRLTVPLVNRFLELRSRNLL